MNRLHRTLGTIAVAGALATAPIHLGAEEASALSADDAFAVISVGSLIELIDGVGSMAGRINPRFSARSLKTQFGESLGDPQLEAFADGSGLVIAFFPDGVTVGVMEVADAQRETFVELAESEGNLQTAGEDGLLVFTDERGNIAHAAGVSAQLVERYLGEERDGAFRAMLHADRLLARFAPEIEEAIPALAAFSAMGATQTTGPATPSPAQTELALRMTLTAVEQLEQLDFALHFSRTGIESHTTATAHEASALADFFHSSPVVPESLLGMVESGGAMRFAFASDGQALDRFVRALVEEAREKLTMPVEDAEIDRMLEGLPANLGASIAASFAEPRRGATAGTLFAIADEQADTAETMESWTAYFLSEEMRPTIERAGIDFEKAREISTREIDGVTVYRWALADAVVAEDPEAPTQPGEEGLAEYQAQLQRQMIGNLYSGFAFEMARVGEYLAVGIGEDANMELLIEQARAGRIEGAAPLLAYERFGAGKSFYGDLSIPVYLDATATTFNRMGAEMGFNPFAMASAMMMGTPPVTIAMGTEDSRMSVAVHVPDELVVRLGTLANAMGGMLGGLQMQGAGF